MTKAKPSSGLDKRMRVHRHNGFSGCARMMQMQLTAILKADSTSSETKIIAARMWHDAQALAASLKTRIDP